MVVDVFGPVEVGLLDLIEPGEALVDFLVLVLVLVDQLRQHWSLRLVSSAAQLPPSSANEWPVG